VSCMRNIAITLCFDGRRYHGWQCQQNAMTVQQRLEEAIESLTSERVRLTACSRTDAGVHANMFVCNFRTRCTIPTQKLPFALNAKLDGDISVLQAREANAAFNSRFDCVGKEYVYRILNRTFRDPFLCGRAWHYPYGLDIWAMRRAADFIPGRRDFSAFMAQGSSVKTTVRDVKYIEVKKDGDMVDIYVCADGFLYNMVRIITGTLVWAGRGKIAPEYVGDIISAGKRELAGPTAPPDGLYLNRVFYDKLPEKAEISFCED